MILRALFLASAVACAPRATPPVAPAAEPAPLASGRVPLPSLGVSIAPPGPVAVEDDDGTWFLTVEEGYDLVLRRPYPHEATLESARATFEGDDAHDVLDVRTSEVADGWCLFYAYREDGSDTWSVACLRTVGTAPVLCRSTSYVPGRSEAVADACASIAPL